MRGIIYDWDGRAGQVGEQDGWAEVAGKKLRGKKAYLSRREESGERAVGDGEEVCAAF